MTTDSLESLLLGFGEDVYSPEEYFKRCITTNNIGDMEKLLKLKVDVGYCNLEMFIILVKYTRFEMIKLLCEYGYNINNYPEKLFCTMIYNYIYSKSHTFLLIIKFLLENKYTQLSINTFEQLLCTDNPSILSLIIKNNIPLDKCPYKCYWRAFITNNTEFNRILNENGYMNLVSDHRIKSTVLIALTTCSRNNQLNFNMSAIILRYCSYFDKISVNDMIQDYVFRKVFKLEVLEVLEVL